MAAHSANDSPRPAVRPFSLWYGVLAAPLAWSAQELISYGAASFLCGLKQGASAAQQVHALSPPFVAITLLTLAVALSGAWIAVRNWRRLRQAPRGTPMQLSEIHAERNAFLARCGLLSSLIFVLAFFFTTAEMVVAPLCGK